MKFFSRSFHDRKIYSPAGNMVQCLFVERISESGETVLEPAGETNTYDMIQSSYDDTLLFSLLKRYSETGDSSLLDRVHNDNYGDLTRAPRDLREAQQQLIDAQSLWNELPSELRSSYENDLGRFLVSLNDGSFEKVIADRAKFKLGYLASLNEKEVSSDESK